MMTIDWPNFTPMASLLGGMTLGLAAAALALCNGRIAGISGILVDCCDHKQATPPGAQPSLAV